MDWYQDFLYVIISNDIATLSNRDVICHMLYLALLQSSTVKETKESETIMLTLQHFIAVVSANIRSQECFAVYFWTSGN